MAKILDKVIRFRGTLERWDEKKRNGNWDNTVVFGKIYDNTQICQKYKVYAGKVTTSMGVIEDFEYDIPDPSALESLIRRVDDIAQRINIDEFGKFTDANFIDAVKYVIHDELNERLDTIDASIDRLDSSVNIIEYAIGWKELEEQ